LPVKPSIKFTLESEAPEPNVKVDIIPPVIDVKFSNAIDKIKEIMKMFRYDMTVIQHESNGVTTSVEVKLTLNK
jgi:hypothetical protein